MLKNCFKLTLMLAAALLISLTSCSKYQKLLKSNDNELKVQKAIEYYNKGDYQRTITLLNDAIPAFRGTSRAEEINYYFAMAHFKSGDYIMASHYLKTFTQGFPRSEHNEEFLFLSAYSKYKLSPRSSLDQTPTFEAIRELQSFINRYPGSKKLDEANALIDELRQKLEKKAFDSAMMYFNIRDYQAAVRTFTSLMRDFPDTQYREEAQFMIMRSHFVFAENSIEDRQLERYSNALTAYQRLLRLYPETRFLQQADTMLAIAKSQISRLETLAVERELKAQESNVTNN